MGSRGHYSEEMDLIHYHLHHLFFTAGGFNWTALVLVVAATGSDSDSGSGKIILELGAVQSL